MQTAAENSRARQLTSSQRRVKFDVTIEDVKGNNLVSNGNRPCTYIKVKFDDWFMQITTDPVENEENPVWKGFPYTFTYETLFPKQNHLYLKKCRFEVWDKQPWSWACECFEKRISSAFLKH